MLDEVSKDITYRLCVERQYIMGQVTRLRQILSSRTKDTKSE